MDRLISEQYLIEHIKACFENGRPMYRPTLDEVLEMIKAIPSAEPKTGHWIDDKCSVCGKGIEDLIDSSEWYQNENPKYCPFCGIKIQPCKAESEDNE